MVEQSKTRRAVDFIQEYLAANGGEVYTADLLAAGQAQGIGEDTLRVAKDRLPIECRRSGFGPGGRWSWHWLRPLPTADNGG